MAKHLRCYVHFVLVVTLCMYLCDAAGIASALDRALTCHTYTIDHPVVDCDGTCDFIPACVCVGGAAQPVATLMGTWCNLGKQIPNCSCPA